MQIDIKIRKALPCIIEPEQSIRRFMCAVAEELAVALAAAPVLRHKDCVALTVKIRHIEAEFADTGAVRSVAGDKQSAVAHGRYYDAAP